MVVEKNIAKNNRPILTSLSQKGSPLKKDNKIYPNCLNTIFWIKKIDRIIY
jgi:hypothetical protein